jgi:hypothetical protein
MQVNGAIAATEPMPPEVMSANNPTRLQQTKVEGDGRVHEGRVYAARRVWKFSGKALD